MEYGLIVAAVAAVVVGIVFGMGTLVGKTFDHTCSKLNQGTHRFPGRDCDGTPPGNGHGGHWPPGRGQ